MILFYPSLIILIFPQDLNPSHLWLDFHVISTILFCRILFHWNGSSRNPFLGSKFCRKPRKPIPTLFLLILHQIQNNLISCSWFLPQIVRFISFHFFGFWFFRFAFLGWGIMNVEHSCDYHLFLYLLLLNIKSCSLMEVMWSQELVWVCLFILE